MAATPARDRANLPDRLWRREVTPSRFVRCEFRLHHSHSGGKMNRKMWLTLVSVLMILSFVLTACGAPRRPLRQRPPPRRSRPKRRPPSPPRPPAAAPTKAPEPRRPRKPPRPPNRPRPRQRRPRRLPSTPKPPCWPPWSKMASCLPLTSACPRIRWSSPWKKWAFTAAPGAAPGKAEPTTMLTDARMSKASCLAGRPQETARVQPGREVRIQQRRQGSDPHLPQGPQVVGWRCPGPWMTSSSGGKTSRPTRK